MKNELIKLNSINLELENIKCEIKYLKRDIDSLTDKSEIRGIEFMYTTSGLRTYRINPESSDLFKGFFLDYLQNKLKELEHRKKTLEIEFNSYKIIKEGV